MGKGENALTFNVLKEISYNAIMDKIKEIIKVMSKINI